MHSQAVVSQPIYNFPQSLKKTKVKVESCWPAEMCQIGWFTALKKEVKLYKNVDCMMFNLLFCITKCIYQFWFILNYNILLMLNHT